jgi:hypothetical protein
VEGKIFIRKPTNRGRKKYSSKWMSLDVLVPLFHFILIVSKLQNTKIKTVLVSIFSNLETTIEQNGD